MKIKIIKPFTDTIDFSSDRILIAEKMRGFYFKDLDTSKPKIALGLARKMIKSGHAKIVDP